MRNPKEVVKKINEYIQVYILSNKNCKNMRNQIKGVQQTCQNAEKR